MLCLFVSTGVFAAQWRSTWGEVTGDRYHSTTLDRSATVIRSIDGRRYSNRPVKLAPGRYALDLQSTKKKGLRGPEKNLSLTVEACKRYYINAELLRPGSDDWRPVIDEVEAIAGCMTNPGHDPGAAPLRR